MLRRFAVLAACCFLLSTVQSLGMSQAPAGNPQKEELNARLQAGAGHLQRGEIEAAVSELKKALAIDSRSAAGHLLLGQAYLGMRSVSLVAEAKAELQQALDLDPTLLWG